MIRVTIYTAAVSVCSLAFALPGVAFAADEAKVEKVTYDEHVKPIFQQKCFNCHNTDKKTAGLDLTSYSSMVGGGASGSAIEPGDSGASYLYSLVAHESEPFMPPNSEKLPDEMLAVIAKWIDGGALENKSSKAKAKKKTNLTVANPSAGRPEGPPPMPLRQRLEPYVRTEQLTAVSALATSPWAPLAAVAGQKQILLYNTSNLELLGVLPFPEGIPYVLRFSRNGSLLLAGGGRGAFEGRVAVYDIKTGERVMEVGQEVDAVLAADINSDHSLIALGGPSKIVRVYSTSTNELVYEIKKHTEWVYNVEFSPDGVLLASADRNGGMFIWEAQTGRDFLTLAGHGAACTGISWRSDSNLLSSCSEDGSIKLWEMENGAQVKTWGAHGGGAESVEFTREGQLVSCGRDRVTKLWDQNGQQLKAFEAFGDIAVKVTHCDETARVIAGDWTGAIKTFNAADGVTLGALTSNPPKLDERLAAATQLIATRQTESQTAAAAHAASVEELKKVQADYDAAAKVNEEAQKQATTAATPAAEKKTVVDTLSAEHAAAAKIVADLEPILPQLKDAAEKSLAAAAKLPDDKEVAAAANKFKTTFEAKTAEHANAAKTATEKATALEPAKKELAAAEKAAADTKAAADAAAKRVADLEPTLKAAQDKSNAAKQAADTAAQSLAQAQADVTRWQNEIAFVAKLEALNARRNEQAEVAAAFDEANAELEAKQTELNTANTALVEAQKAAEAAIAAVPVAKENLTKATADHEAAQKAAATAESAIPALKEATAKAQESATKSPEDKEIAAATQQLVALVEKKAAELEGLKKAIADKAAAIETAKQAIPVAEKAVIDTAAAVEQAKVAVAAAAEAVKPVEAKVAAAKQAVDAATQTVQAAQAEIDQIRGVSS